MSGTVTILDPVLAAVHKDVELHLIGCPDGEPVRSICSHGATVLVGCSVCRMALFAYTETDFCQHLQEIIDGLVPTGRWELAA